MKVLAIVSGGMDSAAMLYYLLDAGHECSAISFDYGQRHVTELLYARRLCAMLPERFRDQFGQHVVTDLRSLRALLPGSSQTDPAVAVPEGHYAAETMKATIVPNRNMILLAVSIGHALATGCEAVAYGAHAGDHAIYPDCREEFADAMSVASRLCDWRPMLLLRPFIDRSKAEIVTMGHQLGVPFRETWSCYQGGADHCGRCGTCVERKEAFALARVLDPTRYEDAEFEVAAFRA